MLETFKLIVLHLRGGGVQGMPRSQLGRLKGTITSDFSSRVLETEEFDGLLHTLNGMSSLCLSGRPELLRKSLEHRSIALIDLLCS